jgi:trehalose-phosphatase
MLASALARWSAIAARIRGSSFAIFVDYDGTLTPIAPRPELATLDDEQRDLLRRVAARHRVAIVTGRAMGDIRRLVRLPALHYAANHGFEITGPELAFEVDPDLRGVFEEVAAQVQARVGGVPGVVLESKGYGVAVHYRQAARDRVPAIEAVVDELVAGSARLRKGIGKEVFEIRPAADWHKGAAVEWLLDRWEVSVPIYLGDDRTDEDAFVAARARDGFGVVVGAPAWKTAATLQLRDPADVGRFLCRFLPN